MIGVDHGELEPLQVFHFQPIDGVRAGAADADELDRDVAIGEERVFEREFVEIHRGSVVADDSVASLRRLMSSSSLEGVFSQLVLRADPQRTGADIADKPITLTVDLKSAKTFDQVLLYPRTDVPAAGGKVPYAPADYSVGTGDGPAALPVSLRDHVESVTGGDGERARQAWSAALADVGASMLFPGHGNAVGEHRSSVRRLSPELTDALTRTARERGVTPSTVLHGAWGLLLGRLLGRSRVVFGSTVSGRGGELAGTESIVGLLINTIPVPMSWQRDTPIASESVRSEGSASPADHTPQWIAVARLRASCR